VPILALDFSEMTDDGICISRITHYEHMIASWGNWQESYSCVISDSHGCEYEVIVVIYFQVGLLRQVGTEEERTIPSSCTFWSTLIFQRYFSHHITQVVVPLM
jgi:hypothetical protein